MSQFDEEDDDMARMACAEREVYGLTIKRLLAVPGHSLAVKRFLNGLDLAVNVSRRMPDESDVLRLKEMAWAYRRQMPKHLARKTNPNDPIVREMEETK